MSNAIDITDTSYATGDSFPSGKPEVQLPLVDGEVEDFGDSAVPARYSLNGEFWSGRGRKPLWVITYLDTGGDLEDIAIGNAKALPAVQEANVRHGVHLDSNKELAATLEVTLAKPNNELVNDAAVCMSQSITLMVTSGVMLEEVKQRSEHGEFNALCESMGISRIRASEAMRYARFAAMVDKDALPNLLMLPKKAALTLANADPEMIELMLSDDHISKAKKIRNKTQLSELARALTETEDDVEKLTTENEALTRELKAVKEREQAHIGGSEYHPDIVKLRKESAILSDQAIAGVSSIRSHLIRAMELEETRDEFGKQYAGAIFPAMAHMATAIKVWTDTFIEMKETYGVDIADIAGNLNTMEEAELKVIETATLNMLAAEQGSAMGRVEAMIANGQMKRGRGRPAKS